MPAIPPGSESQREKQSTPEFKNTNRVQNSKTINKNIPNGQNIPKLALGQECEAFERNEPAEKIEKNRQRRRLLFEGITQENIEKKRHCQLLLIPREKLIQISIHRLQKATITRYTA